MSDRALIADTYIPDAVVSAEHLTPSLGSRRGVADVSLHVAAGAVSGFLFPNGAGKSTTIRSAARAVSAHVRGMRVFGRDGGQEHGATVSDGFADEPSELLLQQRVETGGRSDKYQ